MKLHGKVVAVTGAGNGIGRQLSLALLDRGARVAAIDLRPDGLEETARIAAAASRLSLHQADITDRATVAALPGAVVAHHGAVDAVINNAGTIQPFVTLNELGFDVIDRMIAVNLNGTINVTKAFLPHLMERPQAHLVNVSSMGGFMPFPGQSMYGVAKSGVKLLTEALYAELMDTRVSVSVVMPGAIATDIARNSGIEMRGSADAAGNKALPVKDAARIILDGMEAGKLHIPVGNDARLLWLLSRVTPRRSIAFIQKQMKKVMR